MFQWLANMITAKPSEGEETGRQVKGGVVTGTQGKLPSPAERTIQTWRDMRKHPTLYFASSVATAPIRSAEYGVEADQELAETQPAIAEDRKDFIDTTLKPLWRDLMRNMTYALHYGFQPFEKVYAAQAGRQVLAKLKPLLVDITYVLLDKGTGNFRGATNGKKMAGWNLGDGAGITLPPEKVFWYTHNREGDYWYGESVMERARADWNLYNETAVKASNYYTGIAGAVPTIEYPEGESKNAAGQMTNNSVMATQVLEALRKAVGVAVPGIQMAYLDTLAKQGIDPSKLSAWKMAMFEATSSHGPEFEAGLAARNTSMIRAWLLPERAIAEGEHGTKAEAETQTDTAMVSLGAILQDMIDAINKWIVNPLLVLNFGPDAADSVKLVVATQDPKKADLLREIVKGIFGAAINSDIFFDTFNIPTIFEILDLPLVEGFDTVIADKKARDEANEAAHAKATEALAAANATMPPGTQPPQLAAKQEE